MTLADMPRRPPVLLLGVPLADVTLTTALDRIQEMVAAGRDDGRTRQIATVNVDFIVKAMEDREVREILQRADLCLADGMPLVWASRWFGTALRERVAGADLVPELIRVSEERDWHVLVFGSSADVANAARDLLHRRHPDARFTIDPGPMIDDPDCVDMDIVASINAVRPDIVCVALGNPKQERFIVSHRPHIDAPVMIGVGGSLDMLVGKRRRAPVLLQRLGLEWVVRAVQEPRRLGRRYLHDIRVFTPAITRSFRRARAADAHATIDVTTEAVIATIDRRTGSSHDYHAAVEAIEGGSDLELRAGGSDAERPGIATDAAVATIIGLVTTAHRAGGSVVWGDRDAFDRWFDAAGFERALLDDSPE